ncbi:MAG TPA: thioredoxin fold domain-containing protein [Burkholderiales bacterium]|nr:thioredoxin fold domain-containing protein [Burkholderiales bacterium]
MRPSLWRNTKYALSVLLTLVLIGSSVAIAAQPSDPSPHAIDIPGWFKSSFLDFRDDIAEAAKERKRMMIYFGQDGCPYCRELMRVNFSQKDIVEKTRRNLDAVAVNIWGDREVTWLDRKRYSEKSFAALLKIQFTPTVLFLDEKGNVVLRLNGYQPPHKFALALDYAAGRHETSSTFAEYLVRYAREPASGQLHDEPFFMRPPYDFARTRKGGRPLAILFEQKDCAACDELHRTGFREKEVSALVGKLDVARLELFGRAPLVTPSGKRSTEAEWARDLNVSYTPSILFFDAQGREVFRIEAYVRTFHLASGIDYVVSGAYRKEPSFQRYVQARAGKIREAGGRVEIW